MWGWSLHRPLYCMDGKLSIRLGTNMIWASRADLSAGSDEAGTGALRATSLGWWGILLQQAFKGHMSSWSLLALFIGFSSWAGQQFW